MYDISYVCIRYNILIVEIMRIITPTELRNQQRKYLELAETERIAVKRGDKLIHLVVADRVISEEDLKRRITGQELKNRVFKHIDNLFEDK